MNKKLIIACFVCNIALLVSPAKSFGAETYTINTFTGGDNAILSRTTPFADGDTLNFQNDITAESAIGSLGVFTLNVTGNNFTLDGTGTTNAGFTVLAGSKYTFDDINFNHFTGANNGNAINNAGTLTLNNVNFNNNTSNAGGAIYNNGTLTINNGTFDGNISTTTGTYEGGGAIRIAGGAVTLNNVNFLNNVATANYGGAINQTGGSLTINGGLFSGNSGGGAAIRSTGTTNIDGTTFSSNIGSVLYFRSNTATIKNSTFDSNNGGIYVHGGTNVYAINTSFTNNTGSGGSAANNSGNFNALDCTFSNNSVTASAGAINNPVVTAVLNLFSDFTSNQSGSTGGGISSLGIVNILGGTFTDNRSNNNNGGAIYSSGTVNSSADYTANYARSGGAIYNFGTANIKGGTFSANRSAYSGATYGGGAIYNAAAKTLNVYGVNFDSNTTTGATSYGGGIYNLGTTNITNSVFNSNTASTLGGAIYNGSATSYTNIQANGGVTSFSGNKSNGISNAIYMEAGVLNLNSAGSNYIQFDDKISSLNSTSTININKTGSATVGDPSIDAPTTGYTIFNEQVSNATLNLYDGMLRLGDYQNNKLTAADGITPSGTYLTNIALNLNGGDLNIANGNIDSNDLASLTSSASTGLLFDADLSAGTIDQFTVTGTASGNLTLKGANILADGISPSLTLFAGDKSPTLSAFNSYTNGFKYAFTPSATAGVLDVAQSISTNGLYDSITDASTARSFSALADIAAPSALGTMSAGTLTIFGNQKNIDGAGYNGITVDSGSTLNVFNAGSYAADGTVTSSIKNFASTNGGFVYNSGTVNFVDSAFTNNTAGNGGVIYNNTTGVLNITNGVFANNTATTNLSAVINNDGTANIIGAIFKGNVAPNSAAIRLGGASVTNITNSTFSNNTATTNNGGAISGGGITTIVNSTFTNNSATSGNAGAIGVAGTMKIFADNGITSFSGNTASGVANDIWMFSGMTYLNAGNGGVITLNGGITSVALANVFNLNSTVGSATLTNGTINLNCGISTATVNIADGTTNLGNSSIPNVDMDNVLFTTTGGTQNFTNNTFKNGSRLLVNDATPTLFESTNLIDSTFDGLSFAGSGGAINVTSGKLNITGGSFSNNTAQTNGGGIVLDGAATITGGTYTGNKALGSGTSSGGGAIYALNRAITSNFSGLTFDSNQATGATSYGGAIYNSPLYVMNIKNSTFLNNSANTAGGAIYNSGTLYLQADNAASTFTGNTVNGIANDLYLAGGTTYLNAGNGGNITFNSGISAASKAIALEVNSAVGSATLTDGTVNFNHGFSAMTINDYDGTTNFSNSSIANVNQNNVDFNLFGGKQVFTNNTFLNGSRIIINDVTPTEQESTTFIGSIFNGGAYSGSGGAIDLQSGNLILESSSLLNYNSTGSGGAIYNNSALTFSGGSFTGNHSDLNGGALYNGTTATITNTSFTNNSSGALGGAIYNAGALNILADGASTSFNSNTSAGVSNAIYMADGSTLNLNAGNGGVITFNDKIESSLITNTININNSLYSPLTSGTISFNDNVINATVNLYNGYLALDSQNNLSGDIFNLYGGTILNSGEAVIVDSTLTGNAEQTSGAISTSVDSATTVLDSTFTSNNSITNGGAISNFGDTTITNSSFSNNTASVDGGAIYNAGTLRIFANSAETTFTNNVANGTANDLYLDSSSTTYLNAGNGGSITFTGTVSSSSLDNVLNINSSVGSESLTTGTINFEAGVSSATLNISDGVTNFGSSSTTNVNESGTLFNIRGGVQNFTNNTFLNNTRIVLNDSTVTSPELTSIINSTFNGSSNTADGGAIKVISGNLYIDPTSFSDYNTTGDGGVIYNSGELTLLDTTFINNNATGNGGAVYNDASVEITNGVFTQNQSNQNGGALYNHADATVSTSQFNQNLSDLSGGAIYNNGDLEISTTTFEQNHSSANGGAIYNETAKNVDITSSDFSQNSAASGGAIYNKGELTVAGGTYSNNSADDNGGATYNSANATISNATYTENSALSGGAIYNTGTTTIKNSTFNSNTSSSALGGAIYNGGTLNIIADNAVTSFTGNTADGISNAIYMADGSILNLNAGNGGSIVFNDKITSSLLSNIININKSDLSAPTDGIIYFNDTVSNATINLYNGFLSLKNNSILNDDIFNLAGGSILTDGNTDINNGQFEGNENQPSGALIVEANSVTNITDSIFTLNNSLTSGGAIYNKGNLNLSDSTLSQNISSANGGAIYNDTVKTISLSNTDFIQNSAGNNGGALYNGGTTNISAGTYESNSATEGGAIYNNYSLTVNSADMHDNTASTSGGAIFNNGTTSITASSFDSNSSDKGGAIYNNGELNIINSTFTNNSSTSNGGAIYNNSGTLNITADNGTTSFSGNKVNGNSNAIYLAGGTLNLNAGNNGSITFNDGIDSLNMTNSININKSGLSAPIDGSIHIKNNINNATINLYNGTTDISSSGSLTQDKLNIFGGAINFTNTTIQTSNDINLDQGTINLNAGNDNYLALNDKVVSSLLTNIININKTGDGTSAQPVIGAPTNGNIILNKEITNATLNVFNGTTFLASNNILNNDKLNIYGGSVNFVDQDVNTSNEIYLEGGTLNLNSSESKTISIEDKITSGSLFSTININKTGTGVSAQPSVGAPVDGNIVIKNTINNATLNMYSGGLIMDSDSALNGCNLNTYGGYINMMNNSVGTSNLNNINFANGTVTNIGIDVDLAAQSADRLTASTVGTGTGTLNISNINMLSYAEAKGTSINIADDNLKNQVTLGISKIDTAIYRYDVNYNQATGSMVFTGGRTDNSFSPAIIAPAVQASTGNFLNQVNTYQQAFYNMDGIMLLPRTVRDELKYRNKYASASGTDSMVFSPIMQPEQNKGMWFRPYTTFESVPLKNGPTVSSLSYGTLVGGDTEFIPLKNGFYGVGTAYIGYNGSQQSYNGVNISQNGAVVGLTGTVYKGNFFSALTANIGANSGESRSSSGVDNFAMVTSGLASKTGYNFEINDGKFIIQPALLMSYTFAKTFDYVTASGVNITSDPLNAFQIAPGVKLIYNLKNGWQPYIGASMVWNIMDQSRFYANDVALPSTSIKPYVEYGIGVQRRWGNRFTGFVQTMLTNGGRNGVSLQLGLRWAL